MHDLNSRRQYVLKFYLVDKRSGSPEHRSRSFDLIHIQMNLRSQYFFPINNCYIIDHRKDFLPGVRSKNHRFETLALNSD